MRRPVGRRRAVDQVPVPRRYLRSHGHREIGSPARPAGPPHDEGRGRSDSGTGVMSVFDGLVDWLDSRTGIRTARKHLLDEPIPAGVGWWFVTGSVLILLLSVQLVTGIFLTMYYVPSPES